MLNPENVLALLDEVAAAKKNAAQISRHPSFTIREKLEVADNADKVAANRFEVVAQAYRELLAEYKKSAALPTLTKGTETR